MKDYKKYNSDLLIDSSAPTKEEIENVTKQLKNGKVAGPDIILEEALPSFQ